MRLPLSYGGLESIRQSLHLPVSTLSTGTTNEIIITSVSWRTVGQFKSWGKTFIFSYVNIQTDHEELAEGDVGEDVVCLILATGDTGLLPEVRQLLKQRPTGSQIQHIFSGQRVIQEWVVHVGEQPGVTDIAKKTHKVSERGGRE